MQVVVVVVLVLVVVVIMIIIIIIDNAVRVVCGQHSFRVAPPARVIYVLTTHTKHSPLSLLSHTHAALSIIISYPRTTVFIISHYYH